MARVTGQNGRVILGLLLSDIHFDPFHDPGKVVRLAAAPVDAWDGILGEPASADQEAAFQRLQARCGARGVDTSYGLWESSLGAMKTAAREAKFAMVSGDLVVHGFGCRYRALMPAGTGEESAAKESAALAEKTVRFVLGKLRVSLGKIPVYVALGNNDSGCGDYKMDAGDAFLNATKEWVLDGVASGAEEKKARTDYAAGGYYSVRMRAPMERTRLIVLDDVFLSPKHARCGGKADAEAGAGQMAWLRKELAGARRQGERVWVLGHIPPGVDPFSTFLKGTDVCGGAAPVTFLTEPPEGMMEALGEYADVVRLGIFGHTHMDEMRLFGRGDASGSKGGRVAIKVVGSISPVDGNRPAFTLARVNARTAELLDYEVRAASNLTGVDAVWGKAYAYGETYHEAAFSPAALERLLGGFKADRDATGELSRAYLKNYFAGDRSALLTPWWPQYVCAMGEPTAAGFAGCVCRGK
ncbi:MAG: hypothetical protein NVSMB3_10000 [Acidobacteriaceae bacterium]